MSHFIFILRLVVLLRQLIDGYVCAELSLFIFAAQHILLEVLPTVRLLQTTGEAIF